MGHGLKPIILVNQLQRYEKSLVTNIKKYGIGINQLIVMAMLVLFPEVETLWQRSIFAIVVAGIALAFFGGTSEVFTKSHTVHVATKTKCT